MTVRERFERVARLAAGRPVLTIGIVLALALAGAVLALGLKPSAGTDTFVSSSSASYRATADDQHHFGDDAVIILIQEPLTDLVETKDLATETQLEACLAGQYAVANKTLQAFTPAPAGTHAPYGGWGSPCGKLMKTQPVQVVYGPGTFLNRAVSAVNDQIQGMLVGAQHSITTAERDAYELAIGKGLGAKRAAAAGTAAGQPWEEPGEQTRQHTHITTRRSAYERRTGRGLGAKPAAAAASAAGQLEQQQVYQTLEQTYLNSGISGTPAIDDPQFIPQIVFDQPRSRSSPLPGS